MPPVAKTSAGGVASSELPGSVLAAAFLPRSGLVLATLAGVASTALAAPPPPEVALLSTAAGGDTTELTFQRPGTPRLSAPTVRFRHAPRASVLGAVVPGTRTVVAIAGMAGPRDESWASSLVRLEAGAFPAVLADQVYVGTRPLVTADGRVFVQRGRAGPEPTEEQIRSGELRIDELSIEEVSLASGKTRTVYRTSGYITFLAGALLDELFVYEVRFGSAQLLAVHQDSGAVRVLVKSIAPFARDFSVDSRRRALVYTVLDPAGRQWKVERLDLRSGSIETVARGPSMALAPHAWPGGLVAFNPEGRRGLKVLGAEEVASAPLGAGVDFLRAFTRDGAFATGLHTVSGELPRPFVLDTQTGKPVPLAFPQGARIDVAGFVEVGER